MTHTLFPFDGAPTFERSTISSEPLSRKALAILGTSFLIGVICVMGTLFYQFSHQAQAEKTMVQTFSEPDNGL